MSSIENLQIEAKIDKIFDGKKGFKAFASITICNSFVVHGIKVIESQDGFVIRMPYTSFTDKYGKRNKTDDFEIIWQKEVKRTMDKTNNFKAVERLGFWKGSKFFDN